MSSCNDVDVRRQDMARETWIKNVMRIYGWDRQFSEVKYMDILIASRNAFIAQAFQDEKLLNGRLE